MYIKSDIFKLKNNGIAPKQGSILISEPFAPDAIFSRAIILIARHNNEETIGFILNKPINKTLSQVSDIFNKNNLKVSIGGPVANENIFYIHTYGSLIPGSTKIKDNLYWGGDFNVLKTIIEEGAIDENKIRFFIGYSGWGANQLKNELKKDFWLVSNVDTKIIMQNKKQIWNETISKLEKRYHIWKYFPENPNLN